MLISSLGWLNSSFCWIPILVLGYITIFAGSTANSRGDGELTWKIRGSPAFLPQLLAFGGPSDSKGAAWVFIGPSEFSFASLRFPGQFGCCLASALFLSLCPCWSVPEVNSQRYYTLYVIYHVTRHVIWEIYTCYMGNLYMLYGKFIHVIWEIYTCYMGNLYMLYGKFIHLIWEIYTYYMGNLYILYGKFIHVIWEIYTSYMGNLYMLYGKFIHLIWEIYTCYMGNLYILYGKFIHVIWEIYTSYMGNLYMLYGKFIHLIWEIYTCYMGNLYILYGKFIHVIWEIYTSYMGNLYMLYGKFIHLIWEIYTCYMGNLYILYGKFIHVIWEIYTSYMGNLYSMLHGEIFIFLLVHPGFVREAGSTAFTHWMHTIESGCWIFCRKSRAEGPNVWKCLENPKESQTSKYLEGACFLLRFGRVGK